MATRLKEQLPPCKTGPLHQGWSNRIIGTEGKNMNRQDAKSAKETALCVSLSVLPALCVSL